MDRKEKLELQKFATQIRIETVKQIVTRGFGHLGGSLSIADALAVLYAKEMRVDPKNPTWPDRDIMVCSKGHAGPAVYSTLALKGYFPMDELKTLNQPGTNLPSHCDRNLTVGVDMTTGSLGQGVSTGIGMALAQKVDGKDSRTYIFVGDGESQEGQVWEGMTFAAQYKLDNLVLFFDYNGKQLDGYTKDVMDVKDLRAKAEAFGWNAVSVDGHDVEAIDNALQEAKTVKGVPTCIVLNTVKGKGAPELEAILLNHHSAISEEFGANALAGLENDLAEIEKELKE